MPIFEIWANDFSATDFYLNDTKIACNLLVVGDSLHVGVISWEKVSADLGRGVQALLVLTAVNFGLTKSHLFCSEHQKSR